jgi:hypothetical protein
MPSAHERLEKHVRAVVDAMGVVDDETRDRLELILSIATQKPYGGSDD